MKQGNKYEDKIFSFASNENYMNYKFNRNNQQIFFLPKNLLIFEEENENLNNLSSTTLDSVNTYENINNFKIFFNDNENIKKNKKFKIKSYLFLDSKAK